MDVIKKAIDITPIIKTIHHGGQIGTAIRAPPATRRKVPQTTPTGDPVHACHRKT